MNAITDTQRFVGVWELEGIEDFLEGHKETAPGFEKPVGLLIYLASGWMSVNFAGLSRPPFLREFSPTLAALAAAGSAYGAYAGRWEVIEVRHEVLHRVETAFVPNRVGRTIRRSCIRRESSSSPPHRPLGRRGGAEPRPPLAAARLNRL
jgi:hypothetical protein